MIKNKTFLISGGAGFIGYNLCKTLLENNNEVLILDNYSSGTLKNKNDLYNKYARFYAIQHDITQPILDIACYYHK